MVSPGKERVQPQRLAEIDNGAFQVAGFRQGLAATMIRGRVVGIGFHCGAVIRDRLLDLPHEGVGLAALGQHQDIRRIQTQGGTVVGHRLGIIALEPVDVAAANQRLGRPRVRFDRGRELINRLLIVPLLGASYSLLEPIGKLNAIDARRGRRRERSDPWLLGAARLAKERVQQGAVPIQEHCDRPELLQRGVVVLLADIRKAAKQVWIGFDGMSKEGGYQNDENGGGRRRTAELEDGLQLGVACFLDFFSQPRHRPPFPAGS
jgi:hypothetical protein